MMTTFIRLLESQNKQTDLLQSIRSIGKNIFEVDPKSFYAIPGVPFSYWVSDEIRNSYKNLESLECRERTTRQGLATAEDFRFVRCWWECLFNDGWYGFAKGGAYSPFYADIYLCVKWFESGSEIKAGICQRYPYLNGNSEFVAKNTQFYFRPGLTWPLRTSKGLGFRIMPSNCIFGHKGPAVFHINNDKQKLLSLLAMTISKPFITLVELQLAAADSAARSYEVGIIQKVPVPDIDDDYQKRLAELALQAWSIKRSLDAVNETSHAFLMPHKLMLQILNYDQILMNKKLIEIEEEINEIAYQIYGIENIKEISVTSSDLENDDEQDDINILNDESTQLLSWAIGVSFAHFDWRLATGERELPKEPEPFDPLPTKSPGMLPDDLTPFHKNDGILVDDEGHHHDLPRLMEEVLQKVNVVVPDNIRRWLQKDFFDLHLKMYSKSRRKAPIYWPLSTASGSYTLWLYYPALNDQTLFKTVNDFLDGPRGKLTQVSRECAELRLKSNGRSSEEEKRYEKLLTFEQELIDLRDTLLKIAPTYKPNHDDGVQITAAPLWSLFRHKPWQKVLKDTWSKLEKGDYDWAHLAMNYWPERVREKCKSDKSLAIAHGLEALYVEPVAIAKKTRGKKKVQE